MPKLTKHSVIFKREGTEHDDLVMSIPKTITNDISFQLMFGVIPDQREDNEKTKRHHDNYRTDIKIYDVNELKEIYR
tara:strand:+ start:1278 stop:1508 length:231 start_codon:yes stop_codon:yes gene_type:complete